MISIHNFSLKLGENVLFENSQYEFEENKAYCILGENGAGKTSFFYTLTGFIHDYHGEIKVNQTSIKSLSIGDLNSIFSISTSSNISNELFVKEILDFSSIEIEKVKAWYELFEIEALYHRKISELSEGQRQWIFIARAILQMKSIVLLDEPTAFLDRKHRQRLREIIEKYLRLPHRLVLINTHDIELTEINPCQTIEIENKSFKFVK